MKKKGIVYRIFQKLSLGVSPGKPLINKPRRGNKSRHKLTPNKGVRQF